MGIVDEDSIVLARRGDDLYPALDALRGAQGVRNFSKRNVQRQRSGDDTERVIDAENAGNAERDGSPLVLIDRVKLHAVGEQADMLRRKCSGGSLRGIRQKAAVRLLHDALRVGIVDIDRARFAAAEEHGLRVAVCIHRLMEIEMVLCQICKDSRAKTDLVGAVEHQRVGRDLHNDVRAARIAHIGKELLQLEGLRRGALGVQDLIADHILDSADEADLCAERFFKHVLQQIRAGRFAVRTGDSDDAHSVRRMAEPVCAERGKRRAGIGNQYIRNVCFRLFFADDADRAVFHGLRNIFVAVGLEAGDRDKQCSGRYLPGVILNAGNIQCFVRVQFQHVKAVQQFFEFHSVLLSRMRLWKRILL